MDREIKFRVWDQKRKEMVYFDLDVCNNETRIWWNEQIKGNPIMQYTGLKDRNGKEVYDEDIFYDDDCPCRIIWNNEEARFMALHWMGDGWSEESKLDSDWFGYSKEKGFYLNFEIVGSISEIPELEEK